MLISVPIWLWVFHSLGRSAAGELAFSENYPTAQCVTLGIFEQLASQEGKRKAGENWFWCLTTISLVSVMVSVTVRRNEASLFLF